jgi:hypothetical protein
VANPKLKIKAATAQEICTQYKVSLAAQPLLTEAMPPLDFISALIAGKLHQDAVHFMAHALPKREAVWWSCLCTRDIIADAGAKELMAAIQAAEAWVYRPTEENRRKAQQTAAAIEEPHSARWSAMAAFWSGGSMGPADAPEVKPAEDLTAKAAAGAILMAATGEAMKADERFARFLDYGIDIAHGGTGRRPAAAS